MIKNNRRHIFWVLIAGMICYISACNNYSVSEEQGDSFLKYYPVGVNNNSGTEVIQTSNGYTILGNFESSAGQKDLFIIFTDEYGRQKGEPIFIGTNRDEDGNSIIRLGDGYIIAGTSYNTTQKWGYLVNISSDGRVLWERNYSGYQELVFQDVYYAPGDGTLIMTGYSINNTGDDKDAIIFKAETNGDSSWCRTYSLDGRHYNGEAIIEDQNRYHVLITSTEVDTHLDRIRWLNTNTDGRFQTSDEILTPYISGKDMIRNTAGELFILGNHVDPVSRKKKIFLAELELTSGGVITTLKDSASIAYTESLYAESFAPVGQNGLAIGGWQENPSDNDILFLTVNTQFDPPLLLKTYGSKGSQTAENIFYTGNDGGFALTGSAELGGGKTSMLLKIDSEGELK